MANKRTVWGIDVGNTSLKALRCIAGDDGTVEVLSCDFIEHSKVLSQPGTNVSEVLDETFKTFFDRNSVKGDKVAISISGQNTIHRFLKLPPVPPSKIPDVIRYEAKQWLPFDLSDVSWDFQPLGVSPKEKEMLLDVTVGMFAVKKDLVLKNLQPFLNKAANVTLVQSSPMALYNFAAFDQLNENEVSTGDEELTVILGIGTDSSDVVITDGTSIWTRSIPVGGASFTKLLAKQQQLTYSKAEYVKRNIAAAPDNMTIVQSIRQAFNDTVNEVNRSLEYYQTLHRNAVFKKILLTGNAGKLLGLRQYLAHNLGYEVELVNRFRKLMGTDALESQLFKDNLSSFGISYGLVVQQLDRAKLRTNLIPRTVVIDRVVREKKPWVLAAAAAVLLAMTVHFASASAVLHKMQNPAYDRAVDEVKRLKSTDDGFKSALQTAVGTFNTEDALGKTLTSSVEGRITWLELLHVINEILPKGDTANADNDTKKEKKITSESIEEENRIYVKSIDAVPVAGFGAWFEPLKQAHRYILDEKEFEELKKTVTSNPTTAAAPNLKTASPNPTTPGTETPLVLDADTKYESLDEDDLVRFLTGPGDVPTMNMRVVQITGYHYHNPKDPNKLTKEGGAAFLRTVFLDKLKHGEVELPGTAAEREKGKKSPKISMKEFGISYPVLLYIPRITTEKVINPALQAFVDPDADKNPTRSSGMRGGRSLDPDGDNGTNRPENYLDKIAREKNIEKTLTLRRFDFVIQFAWVETPPSVRAKKAANRAAGIAEPEPQYVPPPNTDATGPPMPGKIRK